MAAGDRIHYLLRLGDLGEDALTVTRVQGREALSEPYRFDVDFLAGGAVELQDGLGKEAVLTLRRSTGEERWVHGEALRLELLGVAAGVPRYRVTIAPRLARLSRAARSRVYQRRTVPQLVDAVLAEHGVAHRAALAGSYPAREYVIQHRETDLAFVSRLLEHEGIWYRFDHTSSGHELVLGDSPSAFPARPGALPVRPESGQGDGAEHLTRLARTRRATSTRAVARDYDFEHPALDLTATAGKDGLEVYEYPADHLTQGEGDRRARTRLAELKYPEDTYAGEGNAVGTAAGAVLEVEGSGKLAVVRVSHEGEQERVPGAIGSVRSTYLNRFEAMPASREHRPLRATPAPRLGGIETATVVGPAGEEIHTDEHGRVKVRFHWDREGPSDDGASCWVRVAQAWAGPGMGASFVPRVGQEVVIRFLDGDPDRPLVTGAVYNGANPTPESLPSDKTRSTLRTSSSTGGAGANELRLEDAAGAEEVYVHAQRDASAEALNDASALVQADQRLEVTGDRARQVLGSQSREVSGREAAAVDGSASLAVGGHRTTTVGGAHAEQIGGSASLQVGGARNVTAAAVSAESVGAALALSVGGAYVVNVGGALNHAVAGLKATQVGGAGVELVGAARDEDVGKDRSQRTQGELVAEVDEGLTISVEGAAKDQVDGDAQTTVTKGYGLVAAAGALEADALKIVVGGKVALALEKSGALTLAGTKVVLDPPSIQLKGAQLKKDSGAAPATTAVQAAKPPAQAKKTLDWRVECGHHAKDGSRPVFDHANQITIVPDKGKTSDKVTIGYKNEETAPPGSLTIGGKSVPKGKADGKYQTYALDAEYRGDASKKRFWATEFWTAWRDVTTYRVENAPLPVEIRVRNPRRYKLEFKFPALKGYKAGEKMSHGFAGPGKGKTTGQSTRGESGWSPSKLQGSSKESTVDRKYKTAGYTATFKTEEKSEKAGPPIVFTVDDVEAKLDVVDAVGKFLQIADSFREIVKTFQDSTPKVGCYAEYELQLMQGTLAAEWYWKEYRDGTAFEYVDVYAELTIIEVTLEVGAGISGFGFKAQLYAQGSGSVSLKVDGCRETPVGPKSFSVPVKGELSVKIGGRFEAGNFLKADANGKTGIELNAVLGVNRPDRPSMLSFDLTGVWSGFTVTATGSVGLFGVGGKKTVTRKIADEKTLFECQWPKEAKYAPPVASRERIRQVVLETLTSGFDAKIVTRLHPEWYRSNDYLDPANVADELADAIVAHPSVDRSPDMVKGLADGIRGDLVAIAQKDKAAGLDYVPEAQYRAYLHGGLKTRLDAMVPPSKALLASTR